MKVMQVLNIHKNICSLNFHNNHYECLKSQQISECLNLIWLIVKCTNGISIIHVVNDDIVL
jgi:hypothetical protein